MVQGNARIIEPEGQTPGTNQVRRSNSVTGRSPILSPPALAGVVTILLVEDNRDLADAMSLALERCGFRVVTTYDPGHAAGIFTDEPDRWTAVVSDQVMPGMTGLALHARLRAIRSDVCFILCTGFVDHAVERAAHRAGIAAVVVKPFSMDDLVTCIRAARTI